MSLSALPAEARRPMDVAVHYKRGHRWLRSPGRPSVLGGGLLERARSTTLALLGATAAVGLAIVALAMNQEWPLVAGSSIPQIPPRHQSVGEAEALTGQAQAKAPQPGPEGRRFDGGDSTGERGAPAPSPSPAASPTGSAEFVVAPSAPAKPQSAGEGVPAAPGPPPTATQPQQVAVVPADSPTAEPAPSTPPPPVDSEPASPPVVASSDTPDESSVPPWSSGRGHAYGRSGKGSDHHDD